MDGHRREEIAMHRFFAADAAERETILLDENESKHARSVLRVRDGETAELLDGKAVVLARRSTERKMAACA